MPIKVTREKILADYNKLKKQILNKSSKGNYEEALLLIESAALLMNNFNLFYHDDDFENVLVKGAELLFDKDENINDSKKSPKHVLFFDYFNKDYRGLTLQYISALIDIGYQITFLTYEDGRTSQNVIESKLEQYSKGRFLKIKKTSLIEQSKAIKNAIEESGASVVISQTVPWDISVNLALLSLSKKITKYLINITDHAFGLGKSVYDYFLEFRTYGAVISNKYRGIPLRKIKILPFYPVQNFDNDFHGLPFDFPKSQFVFSGGSFYKLGGSSKYYEIVTHILNKHKDVVVFFLGNGDKSELEAFIKDNNFENRFILGQERSDLSHIYDRCLLYLNTYPLGGGLMTQYAILNHKVPLGYNDKSIPAVDIEECLLKSDQKFTFHNINDLLNEIDTVIEDEGYRKKRESKLNGLIITPDVFSQNLKDVIENGDGKANIPQDYVIDIDAFSDLYIRSENLSRHNYENLFVKRGTLTLLRLFPVYWFKYFLKKCFSKKKR